MRRLFVVWAFLVAGCAFQPQGPGAPADDDDVTSVDAADETDGAAVTDPDATVETDAADPSTLADASLPLPDALLPLPDAAPPSPDAGPVTEMACSNGDDDDDDGKTDCRDDDCPGCGGLSSCCASGACALICL